MFAIIMTILSFFLGQSNCFMGSIQKYRFFSQNSRKILAKKGGDHFELRLDLNQNSWGRFWKRKDRLYDINDVDIACVGFLPNNVMNFVPNEKFTVLSLQAFTVKTCTHYYVQ